MYCFNCGNKLAEGAKFCDQCGSRVTAGNAYPPPVYHPPQPQFQPQYPGNYGMQRSMTPADYELYRARRNACGFVIFRTMVYIIFVIYCLATKYEIFFRFLGLDIDRRALDMFWSEEGGSFILISLLILTPLVAEMILAAVLTFSMEASEKYGFGRFKGLLTGDIFEGGLVIVLGFVVCIGIYNSYGDVYKILDNYKVYFQEKQFPAGLLLACIVFGILQIIGGVLFKKAIRLEERPDTDHLAAKLSRISSGAPEPVQRPSSAPVEESRPDTVGTWICPKCGTRNSLSSACCKDCEYYK